MGSRGLTMKEAGPQDLERSTVIRRPRCNHAVVMSDGEIGRCYLPQRTECRVSGCPGKAVAELGQGASIETGDDL